MPSKHKHMPIPFRPPADDRAWLLTHAEATGQPVNRVITEAVQALRAKLERQEAKAS